MKSYLLTLPPAQGIDCLIYGTALKRVGRPGPRIKAGKHFNGNRSSGRGRCQGWSRSTCQTIREKLALYSDLFQSMITLSLPFNVTGAQAEAIFDRWQRWFARRGIPALGIAETPRPHFHAGAGVAHSPERETALRKLIVKVWNDVLRSDPAENVLCWRAHQADNCAIAMYLAALRKGGRNVKGKARWLTFQPYFSTNLPKRETLLIRLTAREAALFLTHKLTYDALTRVMEHRAAQASPAKRKRTR